MKPASVSTFVIPAGPPAAAPRSITALALSWLISVVDVVEVADARKAGQVDHVAVVLEVEGITVGAACRWRTRNGRRRGSRW